jgi:hypothetical protein
VLDTVSHTLKNFHPCSVIAQCSSDMAALCKCISSPAQHTFGQVINVSLLMENKQELCEQLLFDLLSSKSLTKSFCSFFCLFLLLFELVIFRFLFRTYKSFNFLKLVPTSNFGSYELEEKNCRVAIFV